MTDVYWFEQTEADVRIENDWLSATEIACLESLRFPKRHADWRLGRWTAKCCLAAYWKIDRMFRALAEIEIRPAACGAPEVFFAGNRAPESISLSHCGGFAVCALATPGTPLGCDVEKIEPRSESFVSDYFTFEEQARIARSPSAERPRLITLLWSGKESVLKALRTGLRLDTRYVMVTPEAFPGPEEEVGNWHPLKAGDADGRLYYGWWYNRNNLLRTVVTSAPTPPPRSVRGRIK